MKRHQALRQADLPGRSVPSFKRRRHGAHASTRHALLQREQALRDNEERTSFALAAARMGVWEIEFTSNRLTWSDTLAPLFGLTPDGGAEDDGGLLSAHPSR